MILYLTKLYKNHHYSTEIEKAYKFENCNLLPLESPPIIYCKYLILLYLFFLNFFKMHYEHYNLFCKSVIENCLITKWNTYVHFMYRYQYL